MAKSRPLGPSRLPTQEDLLGLDLTDLERILGRFGVEVDEAAIRQSARQVGARIEQAVVQGVEDLDAFTWDEVDKLLDRAFKDVVRKQVKGAVRGSRMASLSGVSAPFMWVATMVNTCDSCLDRHGVVLSLKAWEKKGLPGNPGLICNGNCNCELLPVPQEEGEDVYEGGDITVSATFGPAP